MIHSNREMVVKCPHCAEPHPYTEVIFSTENDEGWWELDCRSCGNRFVVPVTNPRESGAAYFIAGQNEGLYDGSGPKLATDIIQHNVNFNKIRHRFDYEAAAIYVCAENGENLERTAQSVLLTEFDGILSEYQAVASYGLSTRMPPYDQVVVHIDVPCSCGKTHRATFYAKFNWTDRPQPVEEFLLADITGTDLSDSLEGLFTKKEAMTFLHKLAIRWHLTMDRILVTAPFVGHQHLKPRQKLDAWQAILSILDPGKSVFVTRGASYTDYKKTLEEVEGLDRDILAEYGLHNKLVAANVRRQDFHAKVYAGISEAGYEVFSGSANLVTGPSLENMSYRAHSAASFKTKYLDRLKVRLPDVEPRCPYFALLERSGSGRWTFTQRQGPRIAS